MVEIEKLPDGSWRVSRVLPCGASMQAAASALERINPDAYAGDPPSRPVPKAHHGLAYDAHPGTPINQADEE